MAIIKYIAVGLLWFLGNLMCRAATPVSAVPFEDARATAELIVASNPDWSVYRIEGQSMEAYYGENSLILVEKSNLRELRTGMLVVYRAPDGLLLAHRVVAHHGAWIQARGFSNRRSDPYFIKADMIVGVVFGVLHTRGLAGHSSASAELEALPVAYCKRF